MIYAEWHWRRLYPYSCYSFIHLKFWRQAWIGTSHDWEYIRWNSGACSEFSHIHWYTAVSSICSPIRFHSFPDVVSVLFLPAYSPLHLLCHWIGCGALTFLIGKPGWHIGASGIIYGLAFFCSSAAFCANMYRLSPFHC